MSDGYRYACCEHCEDVPPYGEHVGGHDEPCPDGCNDGDGTA